MLELPEGVDLVGAGSTNTTIKSTLRTAASGTFDQDRWSLQARSNSMTGSGHAQSIKGFTLDGDSWQALGGLLVENRSGVTIEDVSAKKFNWGGIWLHRVKDVTVTGGQIEESSWSSNAYASGNLNIGKAENVTIDGLDITAHRSGTGYGIKALPYFEDVDEEWDNVVIRNCTIDLEADGGWNNGLAPNISIEIHDVTVSNSRITNCVVNTNISIPSRVVDDSTPSVRVDNNRIILDNPDTSTNYAIEMSTSNMEIDNNYIDGQGHCNTAFADWTEDRTLKNTRIHHNIFTGFNASLIRDHSEVDGYEFINNTVHHSRIDNIASTGWIFLDRNQSKNITIANNLIFVDQDRGTHPPILYQNPSPSTNNNPGTAVTVQSSTLVIRNNLWQDVSTSGLSGTISNNTSLTGSPQIKQTGDRWGDYYKPTDSSNLIDAGWDAGYDFNGSAPDIGRWETGATDVTVSFDSQSGSSASSITVTSGGTYGTLPTVTRSGYAFNGWYTASSGGSQGYLWYNSY